MNRSMWTGAVGAMLIAGCGGGDDLHFDPTDLDLMQGQTVDVKVLRGAQDVTGSATVKVDGKAVDLAGKKLGARAPGKVTLTATVDGSELTATAVVIAPEQITVEAPDDATWSVGSTVQVKAVGHKGEDARDLTHAVHYQVANDKVATVDDAGLVTIMGAGNVIVSATVGDLTSADPLLAGVKCEYPTGNYGIGYDFTMPKVSFKAVWPDGTHGVLDTEQMPCAGQWGDTQTFAFVLSAGWCGPCTAYAQRLQGMVGGLSAFGMKIAIVELEDYEGAPADTEFALEHLNKITSNNRPAIAIGDKDSSPKSKFFATSGYLRYFPTTFVIRTRDMKIIADQKLAATYLPLDQIAANPDGDWSYGAAGFKNKCGASDEEASEPNNAGGEAAPIEAGTHHGGICDPGFDIYKVNVSGAWTASLEYNSAKGTSLEMYVWDGEHDRLATPLVGSSTGTGHETFDFSGEAYIAIHGVSLSSSAYDLTITAK